MPDFSLVPVDHQPDFGDVSLVPVDHDPFGADGATQQAQIQQAQTQTQPAQPQPQSPPPQPATGVGQPNVNAPAVGGSAPGGSQGGGALGPSGGDAGGGPNPTSDQGGSSEPAFFGGYANPTPTESLVTKAQLDEFSKKIEADPTGKTGSDFEGGKSYRFVTTRPALDPHRIDGETGLTFTAISPFYAFDGTRYATFDASPERPVRVTVTSDNKLTIGPP